MNEEDSWVWWSRKKGLFAFPYGSRWKTSPSGGMYAPWGWHWNHLKFISAPECILKRAR